MDESINNIYFLKETIGKFKKELQKFISDPNQQTNNIINLRQNIEELEKNIILKERGIGNQILNNNLGTFIPITERQNITRGNSSNLRKFNSANAYNLGNNNSMFNYNLMNVGLNLNPANLNNCYNNNINKLTTYSHNNINNANVNLDTKNRTFASVSNNQMLVNTNRTNFIKNGNSVKENINAGNNNILADTGVISNYPSSGNFHGWNSENNFNVELNNNRTDIIPNINFIPESYYGLIYTAKKKDIVPEYSTPQSSNNLLYAQKKENRIKNQNLEKQNFKSNLLLRRAQDTLHEKILDQENRFFNKAETEKLMNKYNIATNKNTIFKKTKRAAGSNKFADRAKIQKFAYHNKNNYNGVIYDKNYNPVITQDEISKGILSMINRGLIPKTADLTPAFNRNGHPIQLAKGDELKELYAKTKYRDEVEMEGEYNKIRYNFNNNEINRNDFITGVPNSGNNFFLTSGMNENQSVGDYINYNNVFYNNSASYENDTKDVVKTIPSLDMPGMLERDIIQINNSSNKKIFIKSNEHLNSAAKTVSNADGEFIKAKENLNIQELEKKEMVIKEKKEENITDIIKIKNLNLDNTALEEKDNLSAVENQINFTNRNIYEKDIENDKDAVKVSKTIYLVKMLLFKNFKIIENDEYFNLLSINEEKQGTIRYLIEHFQKLFKKLNYTYAEVDLEKFNFIIKDELKNLTNKDMISCLTEKDLRSKGLNSNKTLHMNLKEAFVVRIQKFYRMHIAINYYKDLKTKMKKIKRLQRNYRLFRLFKLAKILIEEKKTKNMIEWRIMMNNFKSQWPEIKKGPRIEIHINSLSYSYLRNCTIEKFSTKENNQLSRLINLLDPNVEIIYVAPFTLGNEVLSYYFSILSTLGVENAKERFHLIVPVN